MNGKNPFDEIGEDGPDNGSLSNLALVISGVAVIIIFGLAYNFLVRYESYFFTIPESLASYLGKKDYGNN